MSWKRCGNCGNEYDGDWCPNCGSTVTGSKSGGPVGIAVFVAIPFSLAAGCSIYVIADNAGRDSLQLIPIATTFLVFTLPMAISLWLVAIYNWKRRR